MNVNTQPSEFPWKEIEAVQHDKSRSQTVPDGGDAMLNLQRRYLEARRDAGQIMLDAMQSMARRQAELAEEGIREFWAESADAPRGSTARRQTSQLDGVQGLYQR